ncbi:hypothetical protein [Micrococcus luteus]|uniref:hypothetical protein n=1 Tax=Micrococcus luteus TaxID=1270 RepID=UPI0033C99338
MTTTPNSMPSGGCADVTDTVTVTGSTAASLVELLEHCEQFLRTASPVVRTELDAFLTRQPSRLDTDWLIDMLGFNALYLQGKLAHTTDHTDPTGDRP